MINICNVTEQDKEFWFALDRHLLESEFQNIVNLKRGYVIYQDGEPVGVWRWNLLWDSIPFITMIYFKEENRCQGIGTKVMQFWEAERKKEGFHIVMTSTQVDETSQHYYRKMGFEDCGCLVLNRIPELAQPMEMFLIKQLGE